MLFDLRHYRIASRQMPFLWIWCLLACILTVPAPHYPNKNGGLKSDFQVNWRIYCNNILSPTTKDDHRMMKEDSSSPQNSDGTNSTQHEVCTPPPYCPDLVPSWFQIPFLNILLGVPRGVVVIELNWRKWWTGSNPAMHHRNYGLLCRRPVLLVLCLCNVGS